MSDEEDYPAIGVRRGGRILVCYGDDRPDEWIDWLESLVTEFEELESLADEYSAKLDAGPDFGLLEGWRGFCEAAGVDVASSFWEGSMTSGHYQIGWIDVGTIGHARKTGRQILKRIRKSLLEQIRSASIKELRRIKDLDRIVEKTRDDRQHLLAIKGNLEALVHEARVRAETLEKELADRAEEDISQPALDCLRFACSVLDGEQPPIKAGPLVLWSDGCVYAITSRGGVPLPPGSPHEVLLLSLEKSGRPVVQVSEKTVIGGWLSGPVYRRGSRHVSEWTNIWEEEEGRQRVFETADSARLPVVHDIHRYYKRAEASKLPKPPQGPRD